MAGCFPRECMLREEKRQAANGANPADLQRTKCFLKQCGLQAILKLRSFVSPKNLSKMTFNEIHTVVRDYCRPREHVFIAERAMFLSTVQIQGESDNDFLARLREAARYCKKIGFFLQNCPNAIFLLPKSCSRCLTAFLNFKKMPTAQKILSD